MVAPRGGSDLTACRAAACTGSRPASKPRLQRRRRPEQAPLQGECPPLNSIPAPGIRHRPSMRSVARQADRTGRLFQRRRRSDDASSLPTGRRKRQADRRMHTQARCPIHCSMRPPPYRPGPIRRQKNQTIGPASFGCFEHRSSPIAGIDQIRTHIKTRTPRGARSGDRDVPLAARGNTRCNRSLSPILDPPIEADVRVGGHRMTRLRGAWKRPGGGGWLLAVAFQVAERLQPLNSCGRPARGYR
jgi:hypothetical protein